MSLSLDAAVLSLLAGDENPGFSIVFCLDGERRPPAEPGRGSRLVVLPPDAIEAATPAEHLGRTVDAEQPLPVDSYVPRGVAPATVDAAMPGPQDSGNTGPGGLVFVDAPWPARRWVQHWRRPTIRYSDYPDPVIGT